MAGPKVAVVFGGPSAEHEISIRSADNLVDALGVAGCATLLVHLRRDGTWAIADGAGGGAAPPATGAASQLAVMESGRSVPIGEALRRLTTDCDVVFPIIHGTLGEDGALQGFLRVLGIPCVGSSVGASALSMDKWRTKAVLAATTTLRMPLAAVVWDHEWAADRPGSLARAAARELPLVVKPVDAGSSVGVTLVSERAGLAAAIDGALAIEGVTGALAEERIEGDEVTCAVIGNPESGLTTLPPVLIRPRLGRFFDYESKYAAGGADELCPAPLPPTELAAIQEAARTAYLALGCRGFARADFILRDGTPWFLELNSLPGLTRESLLPKAARAAGLELPALLRRLVDLALAAAPPRWRERGAA